MVRFFYLSPSTASSAPPSPSVCAFSIYPDGEHAGAELCEETSFRMVQSFSDLEHAVGTDVRRLRVLVAVLAAASLRGSWRENVCHVDATHFLHSFIFSSSSRCGLVEGHVVFAFKIEIIFNPRPLA